MLTYAGLLVVVLLIATIGILLLCRQALKAGKSFEGSLGSGHFSMRLQTRGKPRDEPEEDAKEAAVRSLDEQRSLASADQK